MAFSGAKMTIRAGLIAAALVFSGSALAADPLMVPEVPEMANVYDWSGPYVGVYVGYGTGTVFTDLVPPAAPANIPVAGPLVGVDAGYNLQAGNFVFGLEGDIAWTNINGSLTVAACGGTCTERSNFLGSVRGRAGVALDRVLLFATGGLAILNETSGTVPPVGGTTGTFTATYFGYVVGAGVEVAATDNLSIKVEYNYNSFNALTAPAGTLSNVPISVRPEIHAVKLGLNWHM
jgi:outer membrane immunogenic protein